MKKIFSKLLFMGIAALTLVACSDVPEPYDINDPNVKKSALGENVISYSKNLGTFKAIAVTPDQPWLQDANYSQATGYQTWEGAGQKSNREVEGWLVSPAVSTLEAEHVKIKFDQTIKYTSYSGWEANHKIFVSDNFDGKDVKSANWKEVTFTPVASPYSDWTTYTSGEIQLPDEMANKPAVFVGFWFKAPATGSTTWELQNFVMEKGLVTEEEEEEGTYISESFSSDFGTFTNVSTKGNEWVIDFKTAKATGYDNNTKTTTESEAYLVSQAIDLSKSEGAFVEFEYILRYVTDGQTENKVLVTDNYTGDPATTKWTDMTGTLVEGSDWKNFAKYAANLPAEMIGKSAVVIALYYSCTTTSSTIEIKNLKVKEGSAKDEKEKKEDDPTPPAGNNLLTNGDFETWADGVPTRWKTACAAGNATLTQSTDAHGGSYSVSVGYYATANKRLAYKETTLKAGTYTFSFYAKSTTADKSQTRAGYVIVNNGTPGSYKYGDYTTISNTEWTQASTTFTLESQAVVCLIMMNPQNSDYAVAQNILVDDASLVTSDGGIVEGGDDDDPTPSPGNVYTMVNSISSGRYVIAASSDGSAYAVATPLGASKNYGYLPKVDVTATGNTISTDEANEFTFTSVDGGFTIQDASGRYYYMKDDFNSFQVGANKPTEGHVWTITFNGDKAEIKNVLKSKTIQYSSQYSSYGSYPNASNTFPSLFKK